MIVVSVIMVMVMLVIVMMIVRMMAMIVGMVMTAMGAMHMGFLLRRKSAHLRRHRHADAAQHFLNIGVTADQQTFIRDFDQCVMAAKVPSGAHHPRGIGARHQRQFFRCGLDQNQRAIVKLECIAVAQAGHLGQINIEMQPFFAMHMQMRCLPLGVIQHHRIDYFIGFDSCFADKA